MATIWYNLTGVAAIPAPDTPDMAAKPLRRNLMFSYSTSCLRNIFLRSTLLVAVLVNVIAFTEAHAATLNLRPNPSLTPEQVVNFQLQALQSADEKGIEATFRFASPANRKVTGPLSRFSRLFDSPQYSPMLNHSGTDVKLISNDGFTAELLAGVVDESGDLHWYRFRLSRQSKSPYIDCWMTDAVMAVPHPGRSA